MLYVCCYWLLTDFVRLAFSYDDTPSRVHRKNQIHNGVVVAYYILVLDLLLYTHGLPLWCVQQQTALWWRCAMKLNAKIEWRRKQGKQTACSFVFSIFHDDRRFTFWSKQQAAAAETKQITFQQVMMVVAALNSQQQQTHEPRWWWWRRERGVHRKTWSFYRSILFNARNQEMMF